MANWTILKTAIADVVRANGNREITGPLLQSALNSIVNAVGEHATFVGVATPSTNPGVPDGPVFYLASKEGIYPNFGLTINFGESAVFKWQEDSWVKLPTGFATTALVDKHLPNSDLMSLADTRENRLISSNGALSETTQDAKVLVIDVSDYWTKEVYISTTKTTGESLFYAFYNSPDLSSGSYMPEGVALAGNSFSRVVSIPPGAVKLAVANIDNIFVDFKVVLLGVGGAPHDKVISRIDKLTTKMDGGASESYDSSILTDAGFYNFSGKGVGDVAPTTPQSVTTKNSCRLKVSPGVYTLKTYTTVGSAGASYPWVLTDNNLVILDKPEAVTTFDLLQGVEIHVLEDGWLYLSCNTDYFSSFSIIREAEKGLTDRVEDLTKEVEDLTKEVEQINAKMDGGASESYDSSILTDAGYYKFANKNIGDVAPDETTYIDNKNSCRLAVTKGVYTLKTYVTTGVAGYVYPWVLTDNNLVILDKPGAATTFDLLQGVEINVLEDGWLYLSCNTDYFSSFSVEREKNEYTLINVFNAAVSKLDGIKTTNTVGLYLPNRKVILSGASISQYNGYFEYAMDVLGLSYSNLSVAGTNIFKMCYNLYTRGNNWNDVDLVILSHIHNYDVFSLPPQFEQYTPSDYENNDLLKPYITTEEHVNGAPTPVGDYTVDEMYAVGYDYAIKKWRELCYNLKDSEGYDPLFGKPCQMVLYTYWHDARTIFNTAIRKLATKWGLPLIKDDENIGFSKNRVHPIANKQESILYCNGTPWGSTIEEIDGVYYGFHPSGISTTEWSAFIKASPSEKLAMLPYIQIRRSAILIDFMKNSIMPQV